MIRRHVSFVLSACTHVWCTNTYVQIISYIVPKEANYWPYRRVKNNYRRFDRFQLFNAIYYATTSSKKKNKKKEKIKNLVAWSAKMIV